MATVKDMRELLADFKADLKLDFNVTIDGLKKQIFGLTNQVGGLKDEVAGLKSEVEVLKKDVDGMKKDIDGIKKDVDGIKKDVDGIKKDVDGIKKDVDGIKNDVDGIKIEIGGVRTDLDGIKIEIDGKINALKNHMTTELAPVKVQVAIIQSQMRNSTMGMTDSLVPVPFQDGTVPDADHRPSTLASLLVAGNEKCPVTGRKITWNAARSKRLVKKYDKGRDDVSESSDVDETDTATSRKLRAKLAAHLGIPQALMAYHYQSVWMF